MQMIILLTGPTGVGKTDTSWSLLTKLNQIIFLDCDWFASRIPFSWENETDVESIFQAICLMIDYHKQRQENNFVITLTIQMAKFYKKYEYYFSKWQLPIHAFRLRCSNQELAKRIYRRSRIDWQKQEELNSISIVQQVFDNLFGDSSIFKLIETTDLTEDEAAAKILDFIRNSNHI